VALQVCVIGAGDMGTKHAEAWHARTDARVAAVFDPIEERRNALAEKVGAASFSSCRAAIQLEGIDVVSVCTPTCFHAEIARFAASCGRHVLTEKPLARSLEQGEAMIRAAREHGVLLGTSLQYRDFPRNLRLKQLVDCGAFGGPLFVRYVDVRDIRPKVAMHRRSMNNGPVLDMACHYFDFVRYLTGSEPVTVFATGHTFGEGKPALAEVDDVAIDAADIQVRFENGHVLSVFVNWGMPNGYENVPGELIVSPTSMARNDAGQFKIVVDGKEETADMEGVGPECRIANLVDAIHGKAELDVTGDNGLRALRVSLAAFSSIETGQAVKLAALGE
jgi:myo-inositol 2-dehydrogenase / D-chiro-inositol 1-dehydrogenase